LNRVILSVRKAVNYQEDRTKSGHLHRKLGQMLSVSLEKCLKSSSTKVFKNQCY
jgi:hypothetical protein